MLMDIFHKVGIPPGVLNTITHRSQDGPEIIGTLVAHPLVRKINFTGSTAVGSIVASLAGKHLKPTLMELGGKAPVRSSTQTYVFVPHPQTPSRSWLLRRQS